MNVLLTDIFDKQHTDRLKDALGKGYVVKEYPDNMDEFKDLLKTADFLVVYNKNLSKEFLKDADKLKGVISLGTSKGSVCSEYLKDKGIQFFRTESPALVSVAEHAFMLMLALSKEVLLSDSGVRANLNPLDFETIKSTQFDMAYNWINLLRFDCMMGKTLGIIGFGTVGKRLARMAIAFDMKVLYYNRTRLESEKELEYGVQYADFDALLSLSDFVSVHLKLNDNTIGMFNKGAFEKMKKTAYFINTSRGPVVCEEDICNALLNGDIAGAGLDVFEYEPLPDFSPLKKFDNVVLTAHSAGIPMYRSLFIEFEQCAKLIKKIVMEVDTI